PFLAQVFGRRRGRGGGRGARFGCGNLDAGRLYSLRLTGFRYPVAVRVGGDDPHDDRHEGVVLAAKLCTLTAVNAFFFGVEPGVAHESGNGVLLYAQRGHPPGMDHVVGGGDDAHFLVDRHHQFAVRFQEIVGTSLRTGINLFIRRAEIGEKADAFALALDVVVAPLPLVAGRLDGDIWRGRILDGEYRLGRRPGHADQDKERHERPDDFDRGVLVELFRLRAYRLAVLDDRINHHREYAEEHH